MWVVRRSKHPMFIKGWSDSNHCMASEIADNHGLLHRHTPTVVTDCVLVGVVISVVECLLCRCLIFRDLSSGWMLSVR